jgi:hypothetical protein
LRFFPSEGEAALGRYTSDEATGVLVAPGNAERMAQGIKLLLDDDLLRYRLSTNARRDARERFDLQTQVDRYLDWYKDLIRTWRTTERSMNRYSFHLEVTDRGEVSRARY